jgi:hypothetical protein
MGDLKLGGIDRTGTDDGGRGEQFDCQFHDFLLPGSKSL